MQADSVAKGLRTQQVDQTVRPQLLFGFDTMDSFLTGLGRNQYCMVHIILPKWSRNIQALKAMLNLATNYPSSFKTRSRMIFGSNCNCDCSVSWRRCCFALKAYCPNGQYILWLRAWSCHSGLDTRCNSQLSTSSIMSLLLGATICNCRARKKYSYP